MKNGFEVEWVNFVPVNRYGDAVVDQAEYEFYDLPTRDNAIKFAEKIVYKDWYGEVRVREFKTNKYGRRDYIGDTEFVHRAEKAE